MNLLLDYADSLLELNALLLYRDALMNSEAEIDEPPERLAEVDAQLLILDAAIGRHMVLP